MQYHHNQYGDVTVQCWYDSFVMIVTSQGVKSCFPNELTPINKVVDCTDDFCPVKAEPSSNSTPTIPAVDNPPEDNRINLNDAAYSAIAKTLPAVGRLTAKRMVERRGQQAEGRFTDFANFKEACHDLLEGDEVWELLEPLVKFED